MVATGRHGHHVTQACRDIRFIIGIVAPRRHGAIGEQGDVLASSGRDLHYIGEARRNCCLAGTVVPPTSDGAVGVTPLRGG